MRNCRGEKGQGSRAATALAHLFSLAPFLLCLLLFSYVAHAHGPYDSSTQLTIHDDALELNAILGMDGAKQTLLNAGMSEADAVNALATHGPSTLTDLSVGIVPHLFELSANRQPLKAKRLQVITDGLEVSFSATYAVASSGDLEVRAKYFDGVEAMKPGSFIAMDENHNIKSSAMLSRAKPVALVKLSAPPVAETPEPAAATSTAINLAPAAQATPAATSPRQPSSAWWAGGLLLLVVVILVLLRKLTRAR